MRAPVRGVAMALAVAVVALGGCAVVRLDVDVYKGPLANHEDVQAEQFGAMAIGVKPLLLRLRDRLLFSCSGIDDDGTAGFGARDSSCSEANVQKNRTALRESCKKARATGRRDHRDCWYDDHIDSFIPGRLPLRVTDQARQVNAILSLYEDRGPSILHPYLQAVGQARPVITAAVPLVGPNADQDQPIWQQVRAGFLRDEDLTAAFRLPAGVHPTLFRDLWTAVEQFRQQFQEVLDPTGLFRPSTRSARRDTRGLGKAFEHLKTTYGKAVAKPPGVDPRIKDMLFPPGAEESIDSDKVWVFDELRDPAKAHRYTQLIFRNPDGAEAKQFVERLVEISSAVVYVRDTLRALWKETLNTLAAVATRGDLSDNDRTRALDALAQVTGTVTQPRNLAVALAINPPANPRSVELKSLLVPFALPGDWEATGTWSTARYLRTNEAIRRAVQHSPVRVAELLAHVDEVYRHADPREIGLSIYQDRRTRKFGLVRELGTSDEEIVGQIDAFLRQLAGVLALGEAGGLERGRPREGITRLLETYLEARRTSGTSGAAATVAQQAREALNSALIHFSEKILLLANHDVLLRDAAQEGGLDRYVLVLQAVGNSIQIQADEQTHRATHRRKLEARMLPEQLGLVTAFNRGARESLDDLVKDLETASKSAVADVENAKAAAGKAKTQLDTARSAFEEAEKDKTAPANRNTRRATFEAVAAATRPAVHAFRSLGGVPPALKWVALIRGSRAHEDLGALGTDNPKPDVDRLKARVTKGTAATGPALVKEIAAWLKAEIRTPGTFKCATLDEPATPEGARHVRLKCAEEYFREPPEGVADPIRAIAQGKRTDVWDAVLRVVGEHLTAQAERADASEKALLAAENALADAATQLEKLRGEVAERQAEYDRLKKKWDDETARRDALDDAASVTQELRTKALDRFTVAGFETDARGMHGILMAVLAEAIGTAEGVLARAKSAEERTQAEASVKRLERARRALAGRTPLPGASVARRQGTTPPGANTTPRSQRDVLDDLIALLRYEQIRATADGGREGRAKMIGDALKVAFEHRAGMAYIRPSSAYLRSSYAATSLQEDPKLAWENMLQRHARRNYPLIGEALTNQEYQQGEVQRFEILRNIDKQFWQNINRVRLAGGGDTNYAIAKDDIGNWYVKAFAADPERIIRSAQRLALFAAGGSMDVNLLRRLDLQQAITRQDGVATPAQAVELANLQEPNRGSPALVRVFDRYRLEYATTTAQDRLDLLARLGDGSLPNRIDAAAAAVVTFPDDPQGEKAKKLLDLLKAQRNAEILGYLATARTGLVLVAPEGPAPGDSAIEAMARAQRQATAILQALANVKRFHDSLVTRLARLVVAENAATIKQRQDALQSDVTKLAQRREELKTAEADLKAAERQAEAVKAAAPDKEEAIQREAGNVAAQRMRVANVNAEVTTLAGSVGDQQRAIAALQQADAAADKNRLAAAAETTRIVRAFLLEFTERRRAAADSLERAVVFLGDAGRPQ